MDSTGSMGEEVKIASNLLIQHSRSLHKNNSEYNFQFGFVYYNDPIDVNTDSNDYLQLTSDINKVGRFCENWVVQNGGDAAEDWVGGYNLSINEINWRNGKRIIIHVCDAPAHGKKYSKNEYDNHKDKKYEIELDNMMKECANKNIEIIGIYKNDSAKECFEECKKIYDINNGKSFIIQFYNSTSQISIDFK